MTKGPLGSALLTTRKPATGPVPSYSDVDHSKKEGAGGVRVALKI